MHPILDVLIPRFVTDEVAGTLVDDGEIFLPVCQLAHVEPDTVYTHKAYVTSFNFFGHALSPKIVEGTLTRIKQP